MKVASAYDRRWLSLAVVCSALVVITIDNTILNVALPTIVRDLDASGSELQWIVDAYLIVFASLLLTAGALGDKFGRKGALLTGLAVFGITSGLSSLATSPTMLIVGRGLMGIGGALIFPTTLSIITNTFEGSERARAIGIWAGIAGVGVVIGPLAGGILIEHFHWGSVFLVNVPVCAVAFVLTAMYVRTSRDPQDPPLDPLGALLSIVALIGILYAVIETPSAGWDAPNVIGAFVFGVCMLALFAFWELHTKHPMLDLRFFENPRFSAACITVTLLAFAMAGSTFMLTQYFQFVLGYSPLETGLMAIPIAIGMLTIAPNAPRLAHRWGTKRVVVLGLTVTGIAFLLYASDTIMSSFVGGGLVRLLMGVGIGLTLAPATESIMGSLPLGKAGVGSAMNDTTRQTGSAVGVAVMGSIFASWYHHFANGGAKFSGATGDAVHDSIGRALLAAKDLPTAQAHAVASYARDLFVEAMRYTYPIGAAFILLAAVVAWRWLPDHGTDVELDAAPNDVVEAEARKKFDEFDIANA